MAERGDRTGLWLYAVVRDLDMNALMNVLGGLSGVARAPVRAVAFDGLVAVASAVPLAEFDEAALARNLEDLDWLAATARAHDRVVSALAAVTTAIPLRLATVFLGETAVREMLAERGPQLSAALDLVVGRTEWGVKAFADLDLLAGGGTGAGAGGAGPGAAYLRRRRAQLSARERAQQVAAAHAERLHEAFAALAVAARRYPPQDRTLSGQPGWMVLNGAYLVDHARSADLAVTVRRVAGELPGVRVEFTGPWSPYSFAGVDRR
jgi:hypothetical protein